MRALLALADPAPSPERIAAGREIAAWVWMLPPLLQYVLIQRFWYGLTYQEIGQDAGYTDRGIRAIERRAIARLRRYFTVRFRRLA